MKSQLLRMRANLLWLALAAAVSGCGKEPAASSSSNSSSKPESTEVAKAEPADVPAAEEPASGTTVEILNVSYDPTRELWKQLNEKFAAKYQQDKGVEVKVSQSHGGSSSQARTVIDGQEADVVTLAMPTDTDAIAKAGLINEGWESRLPNGSLPYHSTIVFVVRKGNPKNIKDWTDLAQDGVEIITPSPKTSGNGKLSFLAAWGSVVTRGGSESDAQEFVTKLYERVPVLDSGARGATTTFSQKKIGDVHLTWENEAFLEVAESKGELEIVAPPVSIRAEPKVAVVDKNVDRKKTRAVAEAYLKFAYSPEGQEIIANNSYRPADEAVLKKHSDKFAKVKLFGITDVAKDWSEADARFFGDEGVFDQIYAVEKK